jgi:hypothetical protein
VLHRGFPYVDYKIAVKEKPVEASNFRGITCSAALWQIRLVQVREQGRKG